MSRGLANSMLQPDSQAQKQHERRDRACTDTGLLELVEFEELFPELHERIGKKLVGKLLELRLRRRMKLGSRVLRRSLSVGSPRFVTPRGGGGGGDEGDEEPLRLHRFKVRILDIDQGNVDVYNSPRPGGQTGSNGGSYLSS